MDPTLLQQMIDSGLVDDQAQILAQQIRRGQGLMQTPGAQGMNVGGTYRASSPLEHAATALARVMGGRMVDKAETGLAQGIDTKRAGRLAFAQGGAPPMLGALSGDPAMAAAGQASATEAQRASQAALEGRRLEQSAAAQAADAQARAAAQAEAARHNRATEALTRGSMDQDAWSTVPDPMGSGFVQWNKKTGEFRTIAPGSRPASAGPAPGPAPLLPGKPTETQRNDVMKASAAMSQLDLALRSLDAAPTAYGGAGNVAAGVAEGLGGETAQSLLRRRYSPEEQRAKNMIDNVVSTIINERAGANVSLQELLRQSFLPKPTDSYEQARQKLIDLREFMSVGYEAKSGGTLAAPAAPGAASSSSSSGTVRVRRKSDGKTGSMPAASFNPDVYEKIE